METTIKTTRARTAHSVKTNVKSASGFWDKVEYYRFGIISMLVVFIGCTGGLAAAFGAQADVLKLALIAFPSIISLALVLAVAPMRAILYLSAVAILLDLIVLIF